MCGIFGMLQSVSVSGSILNRMSDSLRHRGPDDEGYMIVGREAPTAYGGPDTPETVMDSSLPFAPRRRLTDDDVASPNSLVLGHRRLSILDLSELGHQPMSYRGRWWIVYNGEIYNYLELRAELAALGHQFRSTGDTEVILAAYAEWGPACLQRFNGMWGLAIADLEARTLFLARDRFGIKPLYLRADASGVTFASEIKAFTVLPGWEARANLPRVIDYLVWELSDHTSETMFAGVRQVPPGHYFLLALDVPPTTADLAGPIRWYQVRQRSGVTNAEAPGLLRAALKESVRLRLRSDVPVGSCLSGGLDSSSLVALMSEGLRDQTASHRQCTFTACSHDTRFDESHHARSVVAATGVEGNFLTPDADRLFADFDRLVWHQDEPFGSTSIFAQWCIFQAARARGVTVVLDGQGADEILGGYRGFFGAYLAGLLRAGRFIKWGKELESMRVQIGFPWHRSIGYSLAYLMPSLRAWLGRFDRRAFSEHGWLNAKIKSLANTDPARALGGRASSLNTMSQSMLSFTSLPMLLRWEDRNSMAASIEARVPFLDFHVVELALGMSDEIKVGGAVSKRVLRQAMQGLVPDSVLNRRDKMGFVTAESTWMLIDHPKRFRSYLVAAVETLSFLVTPEVVKRFDEAVAGRRPFDHRYWRIMCLATWYRRFGIKLG